jgi:hypothetical protein
VFTGSQSILAFDSGPFNTDQVVVKLIETFSVSAPVEVIQACRMSYLAVNHSFAATPCDSNYKLLVTRVRVFAV